MVVRLRLIRSGRRAATSTARVVARVLFRRRRGRARLSRVRVAPRIRCRRDAVGPLAADVGPGRPRGRRWVGTGHRVRLRTAPVVLQGEPVVTPATAGLIAPFNLQVDAMFTYDVVESVVGTASATLGDHEWRRSPGTVRRKDGAAWLVDQRCVRAGEREPPVLDHPRRIGVQDTADQRRHLSDRSPAAARRTHQLASDQAAGLDFNIPGQPVAPIGRRQRSTARDTQRDLQRVVAGHGLDAVREKPQQRPLDADQLDAPSHIHCARLRLKPATSVATVMATGIAHRLPDDIGCRIAVPHQRAGNCRESAVGSQ
jgi:hypothetical protein